MFKYQKLLHKASQILYNTSCRSAWRNFSDIAECTKEKPSYTIPPFLKLPPKGAEIKEQAYDYFLVLDFEATCDSPVTVVPQEIIEFPVLKVNGKTFDIDSSFHTYVRPVTNPTLTSFCTQLTGITQEIVDKSPVFEDVYENFQIWLQNEELLDRNKKIVFATCGDWDLRYMFPMQCKGFKLPVPPYMKSWINIKYSFCELTTVYPRNMITMMKYCQLEHEGKLHSGFDDCKNIARVLKNLAERGIEYKCNAPSH